MEKGNARDWSLTLNNYTPSDEDLFNRWSSEVKLMIIYKEVGKKGTQHLQGRIIFNRTYTLKALKKLHDGIHWEKTNCRQDSLYMIKKDSIKFIDVDNRKQGHRSDLDDVVTSIKAGATKQELWTNHTSTMIRYSKGIYEAMNIINKDIVTTIYSLDQFPWDPISDWSTTIILLGSSGIGKTEFAKAHFKNPLFVSHLDQLNELTSDNDGIIFDDMDFNHFPRTAQIHLCDVDNTRHIHIRYTTAKIPKGTKRIITCNNLPVDIDDPAIDRRCTIMRVAKDCSVKKQNRTEVKER